jgi:hypothetical protein
MKGAVVVSGGGGGEQRRAERRRRRRRHTTRARARARQTQTHAAAVELQAAVAVLDQLLVLHDGVAAKDGACGHDDAARALATSSSDYSAPRPQRAACDAPGRTGTWLRAIGAGQSHARLRCMRRERG